MQDRLKIAIFQQDMGIGGIQRSLVNLINSIDRTAYDIDLYLSEKGEYYDKLPSDINIIPLASLPRWSNLLPFTMTRALFKNKYQLNKEYAASIDFNGYQLSTAIATLQSRSKTKVIWVHNDYAKRSKVDWKFRIKLALHRSKFSRFDTSVCVSNGVFKNNSHILNGVESRVIHNLVDTTAILNDSKEPNRTPLDPSKYNLISVSRITDIQQVHIAIEILHQTLKLRRDVHLYIVGSGPCINKIKETIKRYSLDQHITLAGSMSNPFPLMREADGFISVSKYEGLAMNILEAKVLGLDIYIPPRLEQYTYQVKGTSDIVDAISKAKKKSHTVDTLEDYNGEIIESFNTLVQDTAT